MLPWLHLNLLLFIRWVAKLNFSETSSIGRTFEEHGYTEVKFQDPASVYVINTCSVTDFADRKCRQAVRKSLRQNPEAKVVVIGCYAQLKPDEIANIPGVDLVLGAAEKFRVVEYIDELSKAPGKGMVIAGEVQEVHEFKDAFFLWRPHPFVLKSARWL